MMKAQVSPSPMLSHFISFHINHPFKGKSIAKMSWQEYVDDHLMCELPNAGNLKSAAIVGLDGGVWAQSPDFPTLSNDEVRH